jgi:hypothetical protein
MKKMFAIVCFFVFGIGIANADSRWFFASGENGLPYFYYIEVRNYSNCDISCNGTTVFPSRKQKFFEDELFISSSCFFSLRASYYKDGSTLVVLIEKN